VVPTRMLATDRSFQVVESGSQFALSDLAL
jgi:hypothetical protein